MHYAVSESHVLDMRALAAANDSLPSFHNSREDRQEEAASHNRLGHWLTTSQHQARVQQGLLWWLWWLLVLMVMTALLRKNRHNKCGNKSRSISPLYLAITVDDRFYLLTGSPITLSMVDLRPRSRVRRKYCGSLFRTTDTTRRHEFARVAFQSAANQAKPYAWCDKGE